MLLKCKGQQKQIEKPESLASDSVASWQSGLMRLTYNRVNLPRIGSVRSIRTLAATINHAPSVVRATSGAIILRREPKDRVSRPTVIVALRLEESKSENGDRAGSG